MNYEKDTSSGEKSTDDIDVRKDTEKLPQKSPCQYCSINAGKGCSCHKESMSSWCDLVKNSDGVFSLPEHANFTIEFPLPKFLKGMGSPPVLASTPQLNDLALLPYQARDLHSKIKFPKPHFEQTFKAAKERKLRLYASHNNTEMVEKYLTEQTDPNSTDPKKRTALHVAASKGYEEVVKLLLQHGADPNQKDSNGNTPLHLAACTSHFAVITILLKAGTNIEECDNAGYSPLQLARSRLHMLRRDTNSSSEELKDQVTQIVHMMQIYLTRSGTSLESDLLDCFNSKLSISTCRQDVEDNLDTLLDSLKKLNLT